MGGNWEGIVLGAAQFEGGTRRRWRRKRRWRRSEAAAAAEAEVAEAEEEEAEPEAVAEEETIRGGVGGAVGDRMRR